MLLGVKRVNNTWQTIISITQVVLEVINVIFTSALAEMRWKAYVSDVIFTSQA